MKKIGQHRIFADHYQFYIFDSASDPYTVDEEWTDESVKRGYIQGEFVLQISTKAHLNDHCVEIFMGQPDSIMSSDGMEYKLKIKIPSGKIRLSSPAYSRDEEPEFGIAPGEYFVLLRVYNPGVENEDFGEMPDEEYCSHRELERYEVYFK